MPRLKFQSCTWVYHNPTTVQLEGVKTGNGRSTGTKQRTTTSEISHLEKEVLESTQARLDLKKIEDWFHRDPAETDSLEKGTSNSTWNVALAAGSVAAATTFVAVHSFVFSAVSFVAVFFVASRDPLEEESPAGAAARVVGRATLESVKASEPKVRAIARAAVTGEEELQELKARLQSLEAENAELSLWKLRRMAVDDRLSDFTLEELKDKARATGLTVGGTKAQLLMRLVEAGAIEL